MSIQKNTHQLKRKNSRFVMKTEHDVSSWILSNKKDIALLSGLDHHIPTKSNYVAIGVEFEQNNEGLLRY